MDIFDGLTALGGLCLFLFGMQIMAEALQRRAGGRLEGLLRRMTRSRWAGFFTGLAVTAAVQSSSAAMVMVVGFVNSGMLTLRQAVGVIMGTNVGTTVTPWLLSLGGLEGGGVLGRLLRPAGFVPLLSLWGIAAYLAGKGSRRDTGQALLGFAVLMQGMEIMTAAMAACGQKNADTNTNTGTDEKTMVYAVEAGSAGEEVAKEKGWTVNSVQDQAAALMEVAAGTSDAAVIDLLMAGAMIGPDTSYPDLTYTDSLTQEEYGIGCRQGSDLADFITSVLAETYQDGTTQALARQFGIREDLLAEMPQPGYTEDAGGDVAYIRGKGTLVVGITEFAPMDYKDDNGQWTGFDAELARLVAQRLGVDVEFVIIEWGQKVNELNSKAIDVVWNGMTLTDGVQTAMTCTPAYCRNAQVIVVPAA